jgi:VWFA-related protein
MHVPPFVPGRGFWNRAFVFGMFVMSAAVFVRAEQPPFRSGVDLVPLNVTVTNGLHQFVTDLAAADFQVLDDGVPQQVSLFHGGNAPIALTLLLDTSLSMTDKLPTAEQAALDLVRRLGPNDLGEIIGFSDRVTVRQPFTAEAAKLDAAIRSLVPGGTTSLYQAIYIGLRRLNSADVTRSDDIRRRTLVVLTDGDDTSSLLPVSEVLDYARRSNIAVYVIGLVDADNRDKQKVREHRFDLQQLASDTGGAAFWPERTEDLLGIYSQIGAVLTAEYTLGFISDERGPDGKWHTLSVRVNRPNVLVHTRRGYFASPPRTPAPGSAARPAD